MYYKKRQCHRELADFTGSQTRVDLVLQIHVLYIAVRCNLEYGHCPDNSFGVTTVKRNKASYTC